MAKSKSTHVQHEGSKDRDELALILQKALNDRQKDGTKVAYFLDQEDDPSTIVDWVSTGSTMLDLAISNRAYGGLPVGRVIEINGLESTGKSLLSAHIIAETQKKGGLAVIIDPENSAAPQFWASLGVSIKDLLYLQYDSLEDMLQALENIIGEVRKTNKDRLLTIITDSIAGAPTKKELESDYGVDGYNTAKAIIISKAMRKLTGLVGRQRILPVFTNQLRMNLKAMAFGDQYVVPGGKGLAYAASVRIRTKGVGRITTKDKVVIGNTIQAQVVKNRCGPPMKTATFDIHFDSGIQDMASWLDYMKDHGLITGTKAGYTFKMCDNQILKADEFVRVCKEKADFKDKVYRTICDNYIMTYRDPNSKIVEDIERVESDEDVPEQAD